MFVAEIFDGESFHWFLRNIIEEVFFFVITVRRAAFIRWLVVTRVFILIWLFLLVFNDLHSLFFLFFRALEENLLIYFFEDVIAHQSFTSSRSSRWRFTNFTLKILIKWMINFIFFNNLFHKLFCFQIILRLSPETWESILHKFIKILCCNILAHTLRFIVFLRLIKPLHLFQQSLIISFYFPLEILKQIIKHFILYGLFRFFGFILKAFDVCLNVIGIWHLDFTWFFYSSLVYKTLEEFSLFHDSCYVVTDNVALGQVANVYLNLTGV